MKKLKCASCQANVEYEIINTSYQYDDDEVSFKYCGKKAICKNCGEEIIVDEVEDYNQSQFENEYRKLNEIITTEEITEILEKYDIGKRPLSLLLGFGEITITRYLNGYVPSKKNSIMLKRILNNPEDYYSILLTNKKNIKDIAYNKSLKAVLGYIDKDSFEDKNISLVSNYIISKIDVTPKALQKILYYIQIFSFKFLSIPAFSSLCKKNHDGFVFGKIYYQYKNYGFSTIDKNVENEVEMDKDLLELCNAIIKYFGCYGGNVLEEFTHNEMPWIKTLENDVIEKELMKEFAIDISKKYNINKVSDIKNYSNKMFENYQNKRF